MLPMLLIAGPSLIAEFPLNVTFCITTEPLSLSAPPVPAKRAKVKRNVSSSDHDVAFELHPQLRLTDIAMGNPPA